MIIQRAELFSDISLEAINEIKTSMVEETHNKGTILFKQDDPATYFYTLMDGRVQLAVGKEGGNRLHGQPTRRNIWALQHA